MAIRNPRYPLAVAKALRKQRETMRHQADLLQRTVEHAMRGEDLPPDVIEFRMYQHFADVQNRYTVRPYSGDIVILRAKEAGLFFTRGGKRLGWQDHVTGRIRVHEFDCSHDTMITEPTIRDVAGQIRAYLDAAGSIS